MVRMAKVFKNGGSQAIRLPKEFRVRGDKVCIKRLGSALMIFEPGKHWEPMKEAIGKVDDDFMADRDQPAAAEEREPLDE